MKFKLYWKWGQEQIIEGDDITDAWNRAGLKNENIQALASWSDAPDDAVVTNLANPSVLDSITEKR